MVKALIAAKISLLIIVLPAYAVAASLCKTSERTVWSCDSKSKSFSLCSSTDLSATTGYLQYRSGTQSKIEFEYPATKKHPKGLFLYGLLARGAALSFKNGQYTYEVVEPLIGEAHIDVLRRDESLSTITCISTTATLSDNSTIALFNLIGPDE